MLHCIHVVNFSLLLLDVIWCLLFQMLSSPHQDSSRLYALLFHLPEMQNIIKNNQLTVWKQLIWNWNCSPELFQCFLLAWFVLFLLRHPADLHYVWNISWILWAYAVWKQLDYLCRLLVLWSKSIMNSQTNLKLCFSSFSSYAHWYVIHLVVLILTIHNQVSHGILAYSVFHLNIPDHLHWIGSYYYHHLLK